MADASGNAATLNTYDEYGMPGASNSGRFQYTGQAWIGELGLHYYKARLYNPVLGRFLQTDSVGYQDDLNLYAYVKNDPLDGTDSSGNCLWDACVVEGVLVAGVAAVAVTAEYEACESCQEAVSGFGQAVGDGFDKLVGLIGNVLESRSTGKNRLPPIGPPDSTQTNGPGTQQIKYGPDGKPIQEWNKGHPGYKPPEDQDHVHDHTPNPYHPDGKPTREPGRPPGPGDLTGPNGGTPAAPTPPTPPTPKPAQCEQPANCPSDI